MLSATLAPNAPLKTIVETLKELVAECNWYATNEGIIVRAMDASHVALCDVRLVADGFSTYSCASPVTMGLNLVSFGKLMKCQRPKDGVTLEAEANGESLDLTFGPFETTKPTTSRACYALKLMDIDTEELGEPPSYSITSATFASDEFHRICKDIVSLGNRCELTLNKDGVRFQVKGDIADADVRVGLSDVQMTFSDADGNDQIASGVFAAKYLLQFSKAASLTSNVTLSLTTGAPLKVAFDLGEFGRMWFYLAPKVEEDE